MLQKRCIGLVLMMFAAILSASAQKAERDYIRKGNRAFKDSVFVDAEVNYRKALEVNPKSSISMYNLGNTLVRQNKVQEAMEQYSAAAKIEKDKSKLAYIFHNIGDIFQTYAKAVEAYKESLRNNPKDDETRYNLALAQKLLKDQEQNQQNQDQNQDQNKEQEKKEQEKKDQENKQDQQNNQQQQPPQSQKQNEQMSKENAEQLLKSVMQDEKDVQDKVKKQQQVIQGGRLEKDW